MSACYSILARGAKDVRAASNQGGKQSLCLIRRHADKAGRHGPGCRPRVAQPCARAVTVKPTTAVGHAQR
eukprot:9727865-Alexandrium_andersonii.AAC.1